VQVARHGNASQSNAEALGQEVDERTHSCGSLAPADENGVNEFDVTGIEFF